MLTTMKRSVKFSLTTHRLQDFVLVECRLHNCDATFMKPLCFAVYLPELTQTHRLAIGLSCFYRGVASISPFDII